MRFFLIILLSQIVISCGVDVKLKQKGDLKTESEFGPDFDGAAAFCDERYGANTSAAEDCFLDYRAYFDVQIGFDTSSLIDYCTTQYGGDPVAQQQCITDLTLLFQNALNQSNET